MKKLNLIGQQYGKLTVVDEAPSYKGKTSWLCDCSCGTKGIVIRGTHLKDGTSKSCGCLRGRKPNKDLAGMRVGKLYCKSRSNIKVSGRYKWYCDCDCGKKDVLIDGSDLRRFAITSCGCQRKENAKEIGKNNSIGVERYYNEIIRGYKYGAKKRHIEYKLSREKAIQLITQPCFYCGSEGINTIRGSKFKYTGIDRIDSDKDYTEDNVVSCCKTCNIAKSVMTQSEFYNWICKVSIHLKLAQ